jgi:hypothetical protein
LGLKVGLHSDFSPKKLENSCWARPPGLKTGKIGVDGSYVPETGLKDRAQVLCGLAQLGKMAWGGAQEAAHLRGHLPQLALQGSADGETEAQTDVLQVLRVLCK